MNTLKQIASRVTVFALAIAILGTGLTIAGDNSVANAETAASVYLTNKGTGYTTESSPPVARTAPSSRKNASTVYVTMTDVTTANAVQNSHLIDANKVVITVNEPDYNTKVSVNSAAFVIANADGTHNPGMTPVHSGLAGSPVIDSDNDGDLSDEIDVLVCPNNKAPDGYVSGAWTGGSTQCDDAAGRTAVWQIVSVANGDSATSSTTAPQITIISNTASADAGGNTEAMRRLNEAYQLLKDLYKKK